MDALQRNIDLRGYKVNFEKLQVIAYKDIVINGIGLRNLGIHFMDYGSEWNVKSHKHSFFEFHYVTDHYTYTSINGMEQKIGQGSFYLMPPGTYHSHREEPGEGHIGFAIRWEFIETDTCKNHGAHPSSEFGRYAGILQDAPSNPVKDDGVLMDGMLQLLKMAGDGSSIIELQLELTRLILRIVRYYKDVDPSNKVEINHTFIENNMIDSAIKFIEENYDQDIDVEDVSHSVHLSYSHLSRLFKKYTGKTITWQLNNIRLSKAQRLLLCSDKRISQVAREVGFNNEYYFCSLFKKYYGVSPGTFRHSKAALME